MAKKRKEKCDAYCKTSSIVYPTEEEVKPVKRTVKELEKIEKTKEISIKEGSAYSIMEGFGLRYITPFALSVGASNFHIGLLNALPSLLGNLSQLFTLKAMEKYSRKSIVFWAVLMQALMWLFLLGAGSLYFIFNIHTQLPPYLVVIIYTFLCFFGAFGSPAWGSWMKDLVSENRGDYFGKRARIAGITAMVCLLIAGFILDYFENTKVFIGFMIIFFIAFLGRTISSVLITRQWEPKFKNDDKYYFTLFEFIKRMWFNNFGKFTIYYSLITLTTAIASPFFAVYILKNLNFSYLEYMILVLSNAIFTFLFMPVWGKFADRYGNLKVMKITGCFIGLIPILYLLTILFGSHIPIFFYLICVEGLSGLIWAGFNLSAGNFIYDAVTRQRVAICVSYFNIIAGIGVVFGSLFGGLVASLNIPFFGLDILLFIFLLSGVTRFIVYLAMSSGIHEVRKVQRFKMKDAKKHIKQLSFHKFLEYFDIHLIRNRSFHQSS